MLKALQPVRLSGRKMEKLRRTVFERDKATCQKCGIYVIWPSGHYRSMHMAHIVARSKGGSDTLENVTTLCPACHFESHSNGTGLASMHF